MTTPNTIQEQINQLQQERDRLPLFDLVTCQQRINQAQTQAVLDPAKRGDLVMAMDAKAQAEKAHERAREIDRQLRDLAIDKSMLEADERRHNAEKANIHTQACLDEYHRKSKELVRAWRQLQMAGRKAQATPGASRPVLPDFNIVSMNTPGSTFSTAQQCAMGQLYWETQEQEQAA